MSDYYQYQQGILPAEAAAFARYGRLLTEFDLAPLVNTLQQQVPIPAVGFDYVASLPVLNQLPVVGQIAASVYGEMAIQVGFVAGQNRQLAGVEYHQGSEVIVAATDLVLLLGKREDLLATGFDSRLAEAFRVKQGQAVEIYGTTLHHCPCQQQDSGFLAAIILLQGTNQPLLQTSDAPGLCKQNTWFYHCIPLRL